MNAIKTYYNFYSGVKELCNISPQIDDIMRDDKNKLPRTHEAATIRVLQHIEKNPPSFRKADPNAHAINITQTGVSYKLNGQVSFGWSIEKRKNNIIYPFRFSINSNNSKLRESNEIKKAESLGYMIYESKSNNKKSR